MTGAAHHSDPGAPAGPGWASERTRAVVAAFGDTLERLVAHDLSFDAILVAPDSPGVMPAIIGLGAGPDADMRAQILWQVVSVWPGRPSHVIVFVMDTWMQLGARHRATGLDPADDPERIEALAVTLVQRSPGPVAPGSIKVYRACFPYDRGGPMGAVRWRPELLGDEAAPLARWVRVDAQRGALQRMDFALMAATVADEEVPLLGAPLMN